MKYQIIPALKSVFISPIFEHNSSVEKFWVISDYLLCISLVKTKRIISDSFCELQEKRSHNNFNRNICYTNSTHSIISASSVRVLRTDINVLTFLCEIKLCIFIIISNNSNFMKVIYQKQWLLRLKPCQFYTPHLLPPVITSLVN